VTTRLESWKAVALYFGRDERTVRRWEAERGLPIRRLPGGSRSRIYAEIAELEAWRRSGGPLEVATPAPAAPAARPPRWRRFTAIAAGVVLVAGGLTLGLSLWRAEPVKALAPPPPAAQRLYAEGARAWEQRTPASLSQALDDFNAALRIDPDYAEAYAGLARTFDLMRQYTQMPDAQAYPLARQAAKHALALNDRLAEAHAALAFADYWGFWDADAARGEFQRAVALDPSSELAHHWYATFLGAIGDYDGSLREIARAQALDPTSKSVRADAATLLAHTARRADGIAALKAAEAADPAFLSPHLYLQNFDLARGDDQGFLKESAALADLTGDLGRRSDLAAASQGYAAGGHQGLLQGLLTERLNRARAGGASAYSVAGLYNLLGDRGQALAWLRQSLARREAELTSLKVDFLFESLHGDPDFDDIAQQVRPA
jgi:tetratricopeptide (TPR) repeat protein